VISSEDILIFMNQCDRGTNILEINYIIKFFDSTFEGSLTYQDFMQIILPCDDSLLRTTVT
jgi:Ca2+-binding EF-hand superfamily protein